VGEKKMAVLQAQVFLEDIPETKVRIGILRSTQLQRKKKPVEDVQSFTSRIFAEPTLDTFLVSQEHAGIRNAFVAADDEPVSGQIKFVIMEEFCDKDPEPDAGVVYLAISGKTTQGRGFAREALYAVRVRKGTIDICLLNYGLKRTTNTQGLPWTHSPGRIPGIPEHYIDELHRTSQHVGFLSTGIHGIEPSSLMDATYDLSTSRARAQIFGNGKMISDERHEKTKRLALAKPYGQE
jgi:hypothetical protein